MVDVNYLENEQKEAWKRIVELEKKAELFKADVIAYKTPIPSDIKYIKGSRNKISEIKNKSEKVFEQANVYLQETKKALESIKKDCEEAKQLETLVSSAKEKNATFNEQEISISQSLESISIKISEIEDVYEDLEDLSDKVNALNANFTKGTETYNKIITLHQDAVKRRNDISSLHREVLGYTETDEETGKETYIEGLKDELEASYDDVKAKLKNTDAELVKLKNTKEEQYKAFINDWKSQYESTKKDIERLLPGALTAGLSSAYATKKRVERQESSDYAKTFRNAIIGLVLISSIPIVCSILLMVFKNLTLDEIMSKLPTMSLALLPLYAPVLWVAYSADKKLKLSKRLIEEYTHKEVVSKTYYGLSNQLVNVKEKDKSNELRDKLLYNLITVNSENPGKLITDYENSNNPIMDFLSNSAKFAKNLDKVSRSIERMKKTVSSSNENKDIPLVNISKIAE